MIGKINFIHPLILSVVTLNCLGLFSDFILKPRHLSIPRLKSPTQSEPHFWFNSLNSLFIFSIHFLLLSISRINCQTFLKYPRPGFSLKIKYSAFDWFIKDRFFSHASLQFNKKKIIDFKLSMYCFTLFVKNVYEIFVYFFK